MQRSRLCVHSFIRSRCVQRIRGRSIYSGAATDTRSSLMLRPGRELEFISNCGREIRFARGGIARIYVIIGGRSETGQIRAFISARATSVVISQVGMLASRAGSRRDVLDTSMVGSTNWIRDSTEKEIFEIFGRSRVRTSFRTSLEIVFDVLTHFHCTFH